MKEWHKLKPELFKKQPYHLTGCDSYPFMKLTVAPAKAEFLGQCGV